MKNSRLDLCLGIGSAPLPQIELCGREQAVVSHCRGVAIIEYDTETVKLCAGRLNVRFYGRDLLLKKLTLTSVMVCGNIASLELEGQVVS